MACTGRYAYGKVNRLGKVGAPWDFCNRLALFQSAIALIKVVQGVPAGGSDPIVWLW